MDFKGQPVFTLSSGHKMPAVGLGTYLSNKGVIGPVIKKAILEDGYRHIDCAKLYNNEEEIGQALQECFAAGIKREDIFVTCKLWHTDKNDVEGAIDASLKRLQLDYLDLYLIHWIWPNVEWGDDSAEPKILTPPNHIVWKQMESLYKKGKAKSIGVSNCTIPLLIDLLAGCEIKPHVNQIEVHPYLQ